MTTCKLVALLATLALPALAWADDEVVPMSFEDPRARRRYSGLRTPSTARRESVVRKAELESGGSPNPDRTAGNVKPGI
mgnify:CR=1 FL=1